MKAALTLLLALAVAPLAGAATASAASPSDRTVIVLLFDGFAPGLIDAYDTPHLDRLRREGAWTHALEPVFPTVSLINQISISTGCWPEHHGIVSNEFLDPQRGRYDHSPDVDWLIGCEHMHQAAERQGVRAGVISWVGRHSTERGKQATVVTPNKWPDLPDDATRERRVLELIERGDGDRPRLILGYFREPDASAHPAGVDGDRTRQAVIGADAIVGRILASIERQPYRDRATLLVTTDHGMLPVTTIINVKRILGRHDLHPKYTSSGTTAYLYFDDAAETERAARELSGHPAFELLRKTDPPPYWHLGSGPRVGDLVISARPPYFIESIERWPSWLQWLGDWGPELLWAGLNLKASHGYPPATPGVQSVLYGWGAGIRAKTEITGARSIDIHPTVMRLLALEPGRQIDGRPLEAMLLP